jgi:hypothetical protein
MEVDVREQDMETLFVTEKLAFGVQNDLLEYGIEAEVTELCRLLARIRDEANWAVVRDLIADVEGSLQVHDDHTGRTL